MSNGKKKKMKKTDGVIYNIPGKAQVTVFTPNKRYLHRTGER